MKSLVSFRFNVGTYCISPDIISPFHSHVKGKGILCQRYAGGNQHKLCDEGNTTVELKGRHYAIKTDN